MFLEHVVIDGIRHTYRQSDGTAFQALETVHLSIAKGEFVCIVGPSGCGKSSLLLMINGLVRPSEGKIRLNGAPVEKPGPDRALVFQEFALLPWRTTLQNVELGPELQGRPAAERRQAAHEALRLVGLTAFAQYFPHQLSGGMRQRVGIARALTVQPEVLLMDEPFGALDAQLRLIMATELLKIWEKDRKTIVFVTHDLDEAVFLADRVVVMSASPGRIIDEVRIDLPRPRALAIKNAPQFVDYRQRIWDVLEQEVRRSLAWQFSESAG